MISNNSVPHGTDGAPACSACLRSATVLPDCAAAYGRVGVLKAHWEAWSDCNLSCSFCYRSRSVPLDTADAKSLISSLAYGGVRQIVFAGGDPSLRRDLGELIDFSAAIGLGVEVQTNAQFQPRPVLDALLRADLVGLSINGATRESHDGMRGKPGNFGRVLRLAQVLEEHARPFVVRTVVSKKSAPGLAGLGSMLSRFVHLTRWSLVQFGAIEDGYRNRSVHEQSDDAFFEVSSTCAVEYSGPGSVNIYPNAEKVGVYFLISPNGDVFGNVAAEAVPGHHIVGNVVTDHACDIAPRLGLRRDAHEGRYLTLMSSGSAGAQAT